jgi:hypothetical protein
MQQRLHLTLKGGRSLQRLRQHRPQIARHAQVRWQIRQRITRLHQRRLRLCPRFIGRFGANLARARTNQHENSKNHSESRDLAESYHDPVVQQG